MEKTISVENSIKKLLEIESSLLTSYYGEADGEIKGVPNALLYRNIREARAKLYTAETDYFLGLYWKDEIIDGLLYNFMNKGAAYFLDDEIDLYEAFLIDERVTGKLLYVLNGIPGFYPPEEKTFKTIENAIETDPYIQQMTNVERNITSEQLRKIQYYIDTENDLDDASDLINRKYEIAFANGFLDVDWYIAGGNGRLLCPVNYYTLTHEAALLGIPQTNYMANMQEQMANEILDEIDFINRPGSMSKCTLTASKARLEAALSFIDEEMRSSLNGRITLETDKEANEEINSVFQNAKIESFQYVKTKRPPEGYIDSGTEEKYYND